MVYSPTYELSSFYLHGTRGKKNGIFTVFVAGIIKKEKRKKKRKRGREEKEGKEEERRGEGGEDWIL